MVPADEVRILYARHDADGTAAAFAEPASCPCPWRAGVRTPA